MFTSGDEEKSGKCHGQRHPFFLNQCFLGTASGRADFVGDVVDGLTGSGANVFLFFAIIVRGAKAICRDAQLRLCLGCHEGGTRAL